MRSERRSSLRPEHHLLYLALCGRDWRRAFTPISNARKLANGAFYGWPLFRALAAIYNPYVETQLLAPFDGHVTPEMLARLRPWLPVPNAYAFTPAMFADGAFPFDAYTLVVETALATV
jgi:hypothetical protein